MRTLILNLFFFVFLSGCYSINQSYNQFKLFLKQEPIKKVIEENQEPQDRIEKLKLVPKVLSFASNEIGLRPGSSYQKYISLKNKYVTWIMQASKKRELKLHTWWFPFIGNQPYLGFFDLDDARKEQKKYSEDGYDTVIGGVSAFSLLGYLPDPLYSSMLDNSSVPYFIETLIHESVHRTLYISNHYSFNENLADFIAKKATVLFLDFHTELKLNSLDYINKYKKNREAQIKFQSFLKTMKKNIENYYNELNNKYYLTDKEFLSKREKYFDKISDDYKKFMNGQEIGTSYEWAFEKGKINNAVILSYSVYEANQQPFEDALKRFNGDLKLFFHSLEVCLARTPESESDLWQKVESCGHSKPR